MIKNAIFSSIAVISLAACVSMETDTSSSKNASSVAKNVSISSQELSGKRQPWSYKRVSDPLGVKDTVERFELRNGDCAGSDCTPYDVGASDRPPRKRARIERHVVTRLEQGEEAWYRFSFMIPSSEFNTLRGVHTSIAQLFMHSPGSFGGAPIWMLLIRDDGRTIVARKSRPVILRESDIDAAAAVKFQAGDIDSTTVSRSTVGTLGGSVPMDTWIDVAVHFKWSQGQDGFTTTYVNGQRVGTYSGPTSFPDTYLEYDYGIYQSGTNFGRGGGGIPPQVIYYGNVSLKYAR